MIIMIMLMMTMMKRCDSCLLLLMCFHLVAARLLEKKSVKFKDQTMLISDPCQSLDTDTVQPVISERHRSTHAVKVTNVEPTVSEDVLRMYFENVKRSHGGDIKDLHLVAKKKKAFITFKDPSGELVGKLVSESKYIRTACAYYVGIFMGVNR